MFDHPDQRSSGSLYTVISWRYIAPILNDAYGLKIELRWKNPFSGVNRIPPWAVYPLSEFETSIVGPQSPEPNSKQSCQLSV